MEREEEIGDMELKFKIILIGLFVFGIIACSGGDNSPSDTNKSTNKIEKKQTAKKTKKAVKLEENIDESLDSDFDEEKDDESFESDFDDEGDEKNEKQQQEGKAEFNGRIKRIDFEPKVIKADSDIKIFTQIIPGLLDDETVLYSFYRNGEVLVSESKNRVLNKGQFKKGDLITVKVSIVKEDEVVDEQKTELYKVENSNPKIVKLPSITVSGFKTYTYEVEAKDIDNDSITFNLEGNVPSGMSIDQFTGKITYDFSKKPSNDKYVFKIIASDSDGGKDIKEITMAFKTGKDKK